MTEKQIYTGSPILHRRATPELKVKGLLITMTRRKTNEQPVNK